MIGLRHNVHDAHPGDGSDDMFILLDKRLLSMNVNEVTKQQGHYTEAFLHPSNCPLPR